MTECRQHFLSRCLSQPVGALNPKRAAFYAECYGAWEDHQEPASHYRHHYSSSTSVQRWLLRLVSNNDMTVAITTFTVTTIAPIPLPCHHVYHQHDYLNYHDHDYHYHDHHDHATNVTIPNELSIRQ